MPLSRNLSTYRAVIQALDTAIKGGGGYIPLPSHGQARYFLQRANMARKLLRERDGHTPFDEWTFRVDDVRFLVEPAVMPSVRSLDDNRAIPPAAPRDFSPPLIEDAEDAELYARARNLAESLQVIGEEDEDA